MARKYGMKNALETSEPTGPGQDGFNYPSHVTKFAEGDFNANYNMVGNCEDEAEMSEPRLGGGRRK